MRLEFYPDSSDSRNKVFNVILLGEHEIVQGKFPPKAMHL